MSKIISWFFDNLLHVFVEYLYFSIIVQVIMEICMLWLAGDMYALIGWGLHHILLFSFLVIFQFQGGCIAFCQCVWGSDKQNLVEKSTKDASEIDGTLFKRKLLRFYWFHWINLVKLLAYRDTNYHCNYINYAQCFPQDPCIFKFKGSFFLTVY